METKTKTLIGDLHGTQCSVTLAKGARCSVTLTVKVQDARDAETFGVQVGDEVTLELFGGVYRNGQRVAGVATACCLLRIGG